MGAQSWALVLLTPNDKCHDERQRRNAPTNWDSHPFPEQARRPVLLHAKLICDVVPPHIDYR